jgi:hypothetical protein
MKIILAFLVGYIISSYMPMQDEQVQVKQAKKELAGKCEIHQYNDVHQFDCIIIKKHLAQINL